MRSLFVLASLASSLSVSNAAWLSAGYFTGWHAVDSIPTYNASDVPWTKLTKIIFAFVEATPDGGLTMDGSHPETLPPLIEAAKANNVDVSASLGGWAGSRFISSAMGSAANRTRFINTLINFTVTYNLDAFDFDWEYMGRQGIGCNVVSPNDTSNFLAFLKEFKADPVGSKIPLSAAVSITPFTAADGNPSTNVSEFAQYLDYITIMNYDIWGSWSSAVGPNAPLNDSCAAPANQQGSAVFAVNQWTNAGFPIDQIALGLASYGHSFHVKPSDAFPNGSTTLAAYPPFNATIRPVGDSWDVDGGTFDKCGALQPNGGNWNFRGLVAAGLLDENGNNVTDIPFRFDNCSQTPYLYRPDKQVMISFDNAESWAAKGKFINDMGMAGFSIWEAGGDHHDILLDAVRSTAGF